MIETIIAVAAGLACLAISCAVGVEAIRYLSDPSSYSERRERRDAVYHQKMAKERAQAQAQAAIAERLTAQEVRRQRSAFREAKERIANEPGKHTDDDSADWRAVAKVQAARANDSCSKQWDRATGRYGEAHKALREAWRGIIGDHGAECMETICVMPTRWIEAGTPGAAWDLAHDHNDGGVHSYLGPAHKECNQAEALARGVSWDGAPSLADLLARVDYEAEYPTSPEPAAGDVVRTYTDESGGIWEVVLEFIDFSGRGDWVLEPERKFLGGPDDHPLNVRGRHEVLGYPPF